MARKYPMYGKLQCISKSTLNAWISGGHAKSTLNAGIASKKIIYLYTRIFVRASLLGTNTECPPRGCYLITDEVNQSKA